jgi:hypothetical protein
VNRAKRLQGYDSTCPPAIQGVNVQRTREDEDAPKYLGISSLLERVTLAHLPYGTVSCVLACYNVMRPYSTLNGHLVRVKLNKISLSYQMVLCNVGWPCYANCDTRTPSVVAEYHAIYTSCIFFL